MVRAVAFCVASGLLVYLSRRALSLPPSHGLFRLFAWEAILGIFFLNFVDMRQWFSDPSSPRQLVSWALLLLSIPPVVAGIVILRRAGQTHAGARGRALYHFERTSHLVTIGPYRYIRHPMYSSLLLLAWGVFLKRPGAMSLALALAATVFLVQTARVEEREDVSYFGAEYRKYMARTKRFVPFVF